MTDEEMAEEYADRTRIVDENTRAGTDCISLVQDYEGNWIDIHERIKQAHLAGLKAGRPKWHKVADGDLPNDDRIVSDQDGNNVRYVKHRNKWFYRHRTCEVDVIAWCETPKLEEVDK